MGFVADTKTYLRGELSGWHEAALNVQDTPYQFPCWRVDYASPERRGGRDLPVVEVTVIVGFSQEKAVEEDLEDRAFEVIEAIRGWSKGIYRSGSGTELISLGSEAEYFGCRLRVEKT